MSADHQSYHAFAMSLKEYNRKRDFARTPEPAGGDTAQAQDEGLRFVVQKHDASRLHFDFRLELDGVLKSWAVPKGPSRDPDKKALAIHVEDHPLDYGDFEGVIPQGQYGGGTVMLWDTGVWRPEADDPLKAYKRGKLSFTLEGEKLAGRWSLVRMHGERSDGGKNWLLIKTDDEAADPALDIELGDKATSIKTGRTMDAIADDADAVWQSNRKGENDSTNAKAKKARAAPTGNGRGKGKKRKASAESPSVAELTHAKQATMHRAFKPQLATAVDKAPAGEDWLHEIKLDGYRLLAHLDHGQVTLTTRQGHDWTHRFKPIARALEGLPVEQAILDGEACIVLPNGATSFQDLQNHLKGKAKGALRYFAFDLVFAQGYDLTRTPLLERKQLLKALLGGLDADAAEVAVYSDHVLGKGQAMSDKACEMQLEGIISKKADSRYTQGRTKTWLKVKCQRRQEFVIVGWTDPTRSRTGFGSLVLAVNDADVGGLRYAGRVGTGFTDALLTSIKSKLDARSRKTAPLADTKEHASELRKVHWVTPELIAEVEFTEWTSDHRLRHPSFKGLREDKPADAIVREELEPVREAKEEAKVEDKPEKNKTKKTSRKRKASDDEAVIAGIKLTNPDRVLYPGQGVIKRTLAEYAQAVADHLLPHLKDRPLSVVRCPQGAQKKCFYQKHVREGLPDAVRAIRVKEGKDEADYIAVDDVAGVVALVQMSVLEFHAWGSRADKLEKPDRLIFDLDPGPDVSWQQILEAAEHVRGLLAELDLETFVKTTGGKGLHVVAPLERRADWDTVKSFAAGVAHKMAEAAPTHYVDNMSKAKRKGRIFIDYLRNGRGATAVAPYSTRARPGAPVSAPLRWDELDTLEAANQYTVANILQRLAALDDDPWAGFDAVRQSITASRMKAVGAA